MNNHNHQPAIVRNFNLKFEQMCSMVAIGQTRGADETLRQLLLQCLVFLPDEKFSNEQQFANAIASLFELQLPEHEIKYALDRLLAENMIRRSGEDQFVLPGEIVANIRSQISNAHQLEERVKGQWAEEISITFPELKIEQVWESLRVYLAKAFQRHGMQTIALLDPSVEIPSSYSESLSGLLVSVAKDYPENQQLSLKNAISSFLAMAGSSRERSDYIVQLADGAFNYFSLTVAEDLAQQFRTNLSPLTLFLDTNFLFGILGLDNHPQVGVSNELLRVIERFSIPFELRHHTKTLEELFSSIAYYEDVLSSRKWSRGLSRAATSSRFLSGVELKYHQQHTESGVDVESFFRPFRHADVLLQEKNINPFESASERLSERANLISEYQEYLKRWPKKKSYKIIDHDMTVLDVVRQLRSNRRSTLEAGALIITCDYTLYRFDWETSKQLGVMPCTVLPNLFWQVLRPFVATNGDFNKAFAETFAIPEFRTIGSGASEACSKMLSLLATYKDFPERTAARMLSNDLLIDKLRHIEEDEEFQAFVEKEIIEENAILLEEKALLEEDLEKEKTKSLENKKLFEEAMSQWDREKGEKEAEKRIRILAEERAVNAEAQAMEEKQRVGLLSGILKSLIISSFLITLFEVAIYKIPWDWLVQHPNTIGIQATFDLMLVSTFIGYFVPRWRNYLWGTAVLSLLGTLLQILGGP